MSGSLHEASSRAAPAGARESALHPFSARTVEPRPPVLSASALADVIEAQIVPRLALLQGGLRLRDGFEPASAGAVAGTGLPALELFAQRLLDGEDAALEKDVDRAVADSAAFRTALLELFAPAARLLGVWWEQDRIGFTDVTLALGRLQRLLHFATDRLKTRIPRPFGEMRSAYFAAAPGEQHTLGLAMLAEVFQLAGWQTTVDLDAGASVILETVAQQPFDVIGFSASRAAQLDGLRHLIGEVRAVARRRRVPVMVGGAVFLDNETLAAAIGADCTARDAHGALRWAEHTVRIGACAEAGGGSI
jgi:methanogenic corrinoid protein MtbC1